MNTKSRSAKKEEIEQEGSRCRWKTVSYDHAAPSQSLSYILHKWLDMYLVKTWENISSLSLYTKENTKYANQNTKYAKQNTKYAKQNTNYAKQNIKYVKQNTKYAISIKRVRQKL